MTEPAGVPASVVGRLLAEISWERATAYREGGRGRENVLVAEVLMALDFLPGDMPLSTGPSEGSPLVHSAGRMPVVFLLGVTPPVLVRGKGRLPLKGAAGLGLESVLVQSGNGHLVGNELLNDLDQVFCWISWAEVDTAIRRQMATFRTDDPSVAASVQRLATSITSALAWHS